MAQHGSALSELARRLTEVDGTLASSIGEIPCAALRSDSGNAGQRLATLPRPRHARTSPAARHEHRQLIAALIRTVFAQPNHDRERAQLEPFAPEAA